jgi:anti-sigma28 factor (negative regulator of flagellin synthesis)
MGIDKIGPLNNYNNYNKKINKKSSVDKTGSLDSVKISEEAKNMVESSKIKEIINNTPDVRQDRIDALKQKINNPDYLNKVIADGLADKIMESLDI